MTQSSVLVVAAPEGGLAIPHPTPPHPTIAPLLVLRPECLYQQPALGREHWRKSLTQAVTAGPGLFGKEPPGRGCWEPGVEAGLWVGSPLGSRGGPRGGPLDRVRTDRVPSKS